LARVLITGTSRGIGYDTTLRLARAGHEVIATMRNPGACDLEKVAREAKLPVRVFPLDVDDDESVAELFGKLGDSIDVLVNNAGIFSIDAVEDESLEQFRRVMETNYFGAVRCTKQVLPAMRKRGSGRIINVTSIAGRIAFYSSSAYAASKFALEAFSESLAQEVKRYGIKVALVEPGIIDTPMATTSLPQYARNTIYPHGRRLHAFFTNPNKGEASGIGDRIGVSGWGPRSGIMASSLGGPWAGRSTRTRRTTTPGTATRPTRRGPP
jgi:NAD(P)-dependent dehydrogenase (short-subunit alcohol dehydrogenase family)